MNIWIVCNIFFLGVGIVSYIFEIPYLSVGFLLGYGGIRLILCIITKNRVVLRNE